VTGGEKCFIVAAAVAVAALAGVLTTGRPDDQKRENLGDGDDQEKEGLGLDAMLSLGFLTPADHTKWHYGPDDSIPVNWSRHRLAYPRRQGEDLQKCGAVPLMHPAFPKKEARWFYSPPAEVDL
jgi:hypothetical protein